MKIYVEIELDGVITAKKLEMPNDIRHTVEENQYIRDYFINLGYKVGYIRIC
ncbi:MAG: hypothetical protein LLF98_02335 [Clostridium sp.]|uniref:hypothetical protein n=1 Tax=Clostridium sp. TaxID=1506 RepID=UPI0025C61983|nr:hypothetical protein [Clostridium sp.]MCE5220120.1 hypothetical protein [Clostridium sp.]